MTEKTDEQLRAIVREEVRREIRALLEAPDVVRAMARAAKDAALVAPPRASRHGVALAARAMRQLERAQAERDAWQAFAEALADEAWKVNQDPQLDGIINSRELHDAAKLLQKLGINPPNWG